MRCFIIVRIIAEDGRIFKGFLVQARTVADGSPVGEFLVSASITASYQLGSCTAAAVSHSKVILN